MNTHLKQCSSIRGASCSFKPFSRRSPGQSLIICSELIHSFLKLVGLR